MKIEVERETLLEMIDSMTDTIIMANELIGEGQGEVVKRLYHYQAVLTRAVVPVQPVHGSVREHD